RPRNEGRNEIPTFAARECVSIPQSNASPTSSSLAILATENHAVSLFGSVTAYGEATDPADIGFHGRLSARDLVATSSYSSLWRTATSAPARAPRTMRSPRSIGRA